MMKRLAVVLAVLAGMVAVAPQSAAHPLGNFSINQYFLLDLRGETPDIYYLLDIAEIPSFRELDALDSNLDEEVTQEEIKTYLDKRVPPLFDNIHLTKDGEDVPLKLLERKLALLQGTGALAVVNIILKMQPKAWTWPPDGDGMMITIESLNHEQDRGIREAQVLLDGRYLDDTIALTGDDVRYQTLIYMDEKDNPVYQSLDPYFRFKLDPGSGEVIADADKGQAFTWTATARAAQQAGESGILLGFEEALDDMRTTVDISPEAMAGNRDGTVDQAAIAATTYRPPVEDDYETQAMAAAEPQKVEVEPEAESADEKENDGPAGSATEPNDTEAQPAEGFTRPAKADEGRAGAMLMRVSEVIQTKQLTLPMVIVALAIAAVLGMGHALSPGHGKTVMAAYLIGERGTMLHAIVLGGVVTLTHVWSVILLGLVTLYAGERFSEDQVSFWAGIASGAIIIAIGLVLFQRRFASYVLARQGAAGLDSHGHSHGGVEKSPLVQRGNGNKPTYGNIMWLGVSGGIVPCPAALIVLLLAIKFGRLGLGLSLILSFSAGLALVLVAIGILVVKGAGVVRKQMGERSPLLALLPVVSSVLITLLGAWVVVWTLIQYDKLIIAPLS